MGAAADVSVLGLAVDSTGVTKANTALDDMVVAGKSAETSATRLEQTWSRASDTIATGGATIKRTHAEMSDAAEKFIASLQREIDVFGKTRGEIARIEASALGLSKAERDMAASLGNAIDQMHREEDAAKRLASAQDQAAASSSAFLTRLREQVATQGMTTKELMAYRAAQLGVAGEAKGLIDQIEGATKATHGFSFETAAAKRELLVLAHELSQGNYKRFGGSLLVLGEQTGAASLLFSGLGIAALLATAAIGGYAALVIKGAHESEALNNALRLTGNYAGLTEGAFNSLSRTVATSSGVTINVARDINQALIATGQFGPRVIGAVADAVGRYSKITGETADKVVADFAKMGSGVARFAEEKNRTLNFLTVTQYAYIKQLEEQGRAEDAELVVLKALSEHLGGPLVQNLGTLERTLHTVSEAWHDFWDAALSVGRTKTLEEKIAEIDQQLAKSRPGNAVQRLGAGVAGVVTLNPGMVGSALRGDALQSDLSPAERDAANDERMALAKEKLRTEETALGIAEQARVQKAGITAQDYLDKLDKEAKGVSLVTRELGIYRQELEKARNAIESRRSQGDKITPEQEAQISPQTQAAREAFIREKYRNKSGGSHTAMDVDIERQKKLIEQEKALYDSRNSALDQYFHAALIDEADYYAGRRVAAEEHLANVRKEYDEEKRLLEQRLKSAAPNQRVEVQKQLVDAEARYNQELTRTSGIMAKDSLGQYTRRQQDSLKLTEANARAIAQEIAQRTASNKTLQDSIEEMGLTQKQLEALRIARLEEQAAREEAQLSELKGIGLNEADARQLQIKIDLLKEQIKLQGTRVSRQSSLDTDPIAGAQRGLQGYLDEIDRAGKATENAVGSAMRSLEDDLTTSLSKGKFDVHSFVDLVISEVNRLYIVRPLLASLFGGGGASGLIGGLGGLLGGSSSPTTGDFARMDRGQTSGGGGLGGLLSSIGSFFSGFFADGGYIPPGQWGITGEHGPEPVYGGKTGATVQSNKTDRPGLTVVNHFTINGSSDRRSQQQIAQETGASVQRALTRNA
jgi:phage-related minor tail protein